MIIRLLACTVGLGVPVHLGAQSSADSSGPPRNTDVDWRYGGHVAAANLHTSNDPDNHLWRSRGTTFHVNGVQLDMASAYIRKPAAEAFRAGLELTLQAGKDAEIFGFSATAPNVHGYRALRHLGPTNVSYLAPAGNGLMLQGGIFASFIGYDGLYAKDNFNYTRPWGADFTPYLMLGANAQYPFTPKVTGTLLVVNGYWHLARANNVPSTGGQIAYRPTDRLTTKHTILYGPHQANTALGFWRVLFDNTAEWKSDQVTTAFEYFVGSERVDSIGQPRAMWMAAQLPTRYIVSPRIALAIRPEVYWDRDGRTTLARQTVKANTTTLELKQPYKATNLILRLEHRVDDSRGPDGGFFIDGAGRLTPTQRLFIAAVLLTFDATAGR